MNVSLDVQGGGNSFKAFQCIKVWHWASTVQNILIIIALLDTQTVVCQLQNVLKK